MECLFMYLKKEKKRKEGRGEVREERENKEGKKCTRASTVKDISKWNKAEKPIYFKSLRCLLLWQPHYSLLSDADHWALPNYFLAEAQ